MNTRLIILGTAVLAVIVGLLLYVRMQNAETTPVPITNTTTPAVTEQTINFKVLDQGIVAPGAKNRKNYAIYDPKELSSFWDIAHGKDGSKPPKVDFSHSYVMAVFAGTKPTSGYSITVAKIKEIDESRLVDIVISEPGEGCSLETNSTSPYQFIEVPYGNEVSLSHADAVVKTPCPKPQ